MALHCCWARLEYYLLFLHVLSVRFYGWTGRAIEVDQTKQSNLRLVCQFHVLPSQSSTTACYLPCFQTGKRCKFLFFSSDKFYRATSKLFHHLWELTSWQDYGSLLMHKLQKRLWLFCLLTAVRILLGNQASLIILRTHDRSLIGPREALRPSQSNQCAQMI